MTNVISLSYSITFVNEFADRLRHARQLRGLTQAALARACGLSQGAIANYEGKSRRTAKEIFKLADALRVSPVWLSRGFGLMEPNAPPAIAAADASVKATGQPHATASRPFPSISPETGHASGRDGVRPPV